MGFINIRNTVRAHLLRERAEVLLAVVIPFVFMIESGYACGWVLAGGHLGFDVLSAMSFARGFGIEALVFVCFKLVRVFFLKGMRLAPVIPLLVGIVAMIVSAGMNLGFMAQSPEMAGAMAKVAAFMPDWMTSVFRQGLGLLFPIGVALFALFDVRHLIDEMIASAPLDNQALHIQRSEMHRDAYLKSLKKAKEEVADQYDDVALVDAQKQVDAVRNGDLSFGANDLHQLPQRASSVTKVTPVPSSAPGLLPPPGQSRQGVPLLPLPSQGSQKP